MGKGNDESVSPELRELLYFMEHTNDNERVYRSSRVRDIRESVKKIQRDAEVTMRYLHELEARTSSKEEGLKEGFNEGRKEGRKEERQQAKKIFRLHYDEGKSNEEIAKICNVTEDVVADTLN